MCLRLYVLTCLRLLLPSYSHFIIGTCILFVLRTSFFILTSLTVEFHTAKIEASFRYCFRNLCGACAMRNLLDGDVKCAEDFTSLWTVFTTTLHKCGIWINLWRNSISDIDN